MEHFSKKMSNTYWDNCLKIEKLKAQKLTIHFEKSFGSIPGSMALRMGRR